MRRQGLEASFWSQTVRQAVVNFKDGLEDRSDSELERLLDQGRG